MGEKEEEAYTWRFAASRTPAGERGAIRSETAMSPATMKAMVVHNPKVFCVLINVLYMVGEVGEDAGGQLGRRRRGSFA